MKRNVVLSVAVLLAGYTYGAYHFSSELVAFKVKSSAQILKENQLTGPASVGLPAPEVVSFKGRGSGKPETIAAWYFPNPVGRCGTVLQHGHTSRKDGSLKYAPLFWKRGCSLLLVDARHHGDSTGSFGTFGYHEKYDIQDAVQYLAGRTALRKNRIGLFGDSMGACIVLQAAAMEPDLAFVVVDSPFADFIPSVVDRAVTLYGKPIVALLPLTMRIAAWRADFDPSDVSPARYAGRVRAPVFIIHAKDDEIIRYHYSEEVFQGVSHKAKVVHITDWGAKHCHSLNVKPREYNAYLDDFFAQYVRL